MIDRNPVEYTLLFSDNPTNSGKISVKKSDQGRSKITWYNCNPSIFFYTRALIDNSSLADFQVALSATLVEYVQPYRIFGLSPSGGLGKMNKAVDGFVARVWRWTENEEEGDKALLLPLTRARSRCD